jgi:hypothetical protein
MAPELKCWRLKQLCPDTDVQSESEVRSPFLDSYVHRTEGSIVVARVESQ